MQAASRQPSGSRVHAPGCRRWRRSGRPAQCAPAGCSPCAGWSWSRSGCAPAAPARWPPGCAWLPPTPCAGDAGLGHIRAPLPACWCHACWGLARSQEPWSTHGQSQAAAAEQAAAPGKWPSCAQHAGASCGVACAVPALRTPGTARACAVRQPGALQVGRTRRARRSAPGGLLWTGPPLCTPARCSSAGTPSCHRLHCCTQASAACGHLQGVRSRQAPRTRLSLRVELKHLSELVGGQAQGLQLQGAAGRLGDEHQAVQLAGARVGGCIRLHRHGASAAAGDPSKSVGPSITAPRAACCKPEAGWGQAKAPALRRFGVQTSRSKCSRSSVSMADAMASHISWPGQPRTQLPAVPSGGRESCTSRLARPQSAPSVQPASGPAEHALRRCGACWDAIEWARSQAHRSG